MTINIINISKSFAIGKETKVNVLKEISLTINDGEMIAIIGRSGAGKSTLLNIIGCLDNADNGEYYLDKLCIHNLPESKLANIRNSKFGFVMQDFALIEDESVKHNIELPALFSKSKKNIDYFQISKKFGINKLLDRKVSLLSGGEKQRTAIARALINNPPYIIADEPTGALDSKTSSEIMELFKSLNKEGKTIIIVTHDPEIAQQCDRIIEISDGKII